MKRITWLLVAWALAFAAPALAYDAPLISIKRLSIGARHEWQSWSGNHSPVLEQIRLKNEWATGATAAYQLLGGVNREGKKMPTVSLTYRLTYGWDSRLFQNAVGVNLLLFRGSD
jgi:hypothetical protein